MWLVELHSFWRIWEGEYVSSIFQLLEAGCVLWLTAESLWSPLSTFFLWLWLSCLPLIGTLVIKMDNLPISRSLNYHIWKVFLPCKATYSQVLRIRTWTSLEGHYSAYHSLPSGPQRFTSTPYAKYIYPIPRLLKVSTCNGMNSNSIFSSKSYDLKVPNLII